MRRYQSTQGTAGNPWPSPWVVTLGLGAAGTGGAGDIQGNAMRATTPLPNSIGSYNQSFRAVLKVPGLRDFLCRVVPSQAWSVENFFAIGWGTGLWSYDGTNGPDNGYRWQTAIADGGATPMEINRSSDQTGSRTDTALADVAGSGFTGSAGQWFRLRRGEGGMSVNLLGKTWADGSPEPNAWDAIATDTAQPGNLHSLGHLYPIVSINTGNANAAYSFTLDQVSWDDLMPPLDRRRLVRR